MKSTWAYVLSFFVFGGISCQSDDPTPNPHAKTIEIIGHGGNGFQTYYQNLPENSWPSFEKALFGLGIDGVEMDIQMTADGALLLYHDQNLITQTNCSGCIRQKQLEDVKDCVYRFGQSSSAPKLLSFESFLTKTAPLHGTVSFYLDLKFFENCRTNGEDFAAYFEEMSPNLTTLLESYDLVNSTVIEFSNENVLANFKQNYPNFTAYHYQSNFANEIAATIESGADGIVIMNDRITKAQVKNAHAQGLKVCILTGGTLSSIRDAIDKGPDAIQTDNPILLKKLLHE